MEKGKGKEGRKHWRKTWRVEGKGGGDGASGAGGGKGTKLSARRRGEYRAVALLQAPHFCQHWHLYLLNALLMPHHICCCKLLLRPILDDEEKGTEMGARVLQVLFLMEERKGKISGTSYSWVCYSLLISVFSSFDPFPLSPSPSSTLIFIVLI